jgi:hypothetical protein
VMCCPRVPLDLLDESLLVARAALEPAVALKIFSTTSRNRRVLWIAGPHNHAATSATPFYAAARKRRSLTSSVTGT